MVDYSSGSLFRPVQFDFSSGLRFVQEQDRITLEQDKLQLARRQQEFDETNQQAINDLREREADQRDQQIDLAKQAAARDQARLGLERLGFFANKGFKAASLVTEFFERGWTNSIDRAKIELGQRQVAVEEGRLALEQEAVQSEEARSERSLNALNQMLNIFNSPQARVVEASENQVVQEVVQGNTGWWGAYDTMRKVVGTLPPDFLKFAKSQGVDLSARPKNILGSIMSVLRSKDTLIEEKIELIQGFDQRAAAGWPFDTTVSNSVNEARKEIRDQAHRVISETPSMSEIFRGVRSAALEAGQPISLIGTAQQSLDFFNNRLGDISNVTSGYRSRPADEDLEKLESEARYFGNALNAFNDNRATQEQATRLYTVAYSGVSPSEVPLQQRFIEFSKGGTVPPQLIEELRLGVNTPQGLFSLLSVMEWAENQIDFAGSSDTAREIARSVDLMTKDMTPEQRYRLQAAEGLMWQNREMLIDPSPEELAGLMQTIDQQASEAAQQAKDYVPQANDGSGASGFTAPFESFAKEKSSKTFRTRVGLDNMSPLQRAEVADAFSTLYYLQRSANQNEEQSRTTAAQQIAESFGPSFMDSDNQIDSPPRVVAREQGLPWLAEDEGLVTELTAALFNYEVGNLIMADPEIVRATTISTPQGEVTVSGSTYLKGFEPVSTRIYNAETNTYTTGYRLRNRKTGEFLSVNGKVPAYAPNFDIGSQPMHEVLLADPELLERYLMAARTSDNNVDLAFRAGEALAALKKSQVPPTTADLISSNNTPEWMPTFLLKFNAKEEMSPETIVSAIDYSLGNRLSDPRMPKRTAERFRKEFSIPESVEPKDFGNWIQNNIEAVPEEAIRGRMKAAAGRLDWQVKKKGQQLRVRLEAELEAILDRKIDELFKFSEAGTAQRAIEEGVRQLEFDRELRYRIFGR